MNDSTVIDVMDQAPKGRVVGQMPACPSWCDVEAHDRWDCGKWQGVRHVGHVGDFPGGSIEVTVIDHVTASGEIQRPYMPTFHLTDTDELDLPQAGALAEALDKAVAMVEAECLQVADKVSE